MGSNPTHSVQKPAVLAGFLFFPKIRVTKVVNGHGVYAIMTMAEADEYDRLKAAKALAGNLKRAVDVSQNLPKPLSYLLPCIDNIFTVNTQPFYNLSARSHFLYILCA